MSPEQKVRMQLTELVIGKIQIATENKEQADEVIDIVEKLTNYVMDGKNPVKPLTASEWEAMNTQSSVEKLPQIQLDIIGEISKSLELLGANSGLMACVGSWGDTLPQEDILQMLKEWNDKAVKENWIKSQAIIA